MTSPTKTWTDENTIAALCEENARLRALLEIAEAKAAHAERVNKLVREFADETAAADGSDMPLAMVAGRLRRLVGGEW